MGGSISTLRALTGRPRTVAGPCSLGGLAAGQDGGQLQEETGRESTAGATHSEVFREVWTLVLCTVPC